jgi:F-type H+-transporting ATPase subunit delta
MIGQRVARRYALALMGTAGDTAALESLRADVERVNSIVRASTDLRAFLNSPAVNKEKKINVLTSVFSGSVGKQMFDFIILLARKRREGVLNHVATQFQLLYDLRVGIVRPRVTSAVALETEQQRLLVQALESVLKKTVKVSYHVDPAILGGLQVQVADTVSDGSVRHMLAQLGKRMRTGTV